ncbi:hypothetical protein NDU88_001657 [Pleurodeles waltl]|uniref:Uncharacterized protein n=1 Tax=Pleurodeles waltl TaxID=8319 RepID=A0AAV7V8F0_PLEWA|nr:hypothetical protein NDU88_001657 [Pleurodeles waltl]
MAPARHRKPPRRSGRAPGPPCRTRASRAGAAPFTPCSPPRSEGGARRRPSGRDPPSGRASALTGLLAAPQPAAVDFVGDPKPTSGLPGASRSGRHLELLFTGAAGSPYEGELPAFHRFAPTDFSTGPRDTGAPCSATVDQSESSRRDSTMDTNPEEGVHLEESPSATQRTSTQRTSRYLAKRRSKGSAEKPLKDARNLQRMDARDQRKRSSGKRRSGSPTGREASWTGLPWLAHEPRREASLGFFSLLIGRVAGSVG